MNGGQVGQAGGDVQEPLGQVLPQLQVIEGPLETLPQLCPGRIVEPGVLALHTARASQSTDPERREQGQSRAKASTQAARASRGCPPNTWAAASVYGHTLRNLVGTCEHWGRTE